MIRKRTLQAATLAGAPATAAAQGGSGYGHMMSWGGGMLWGPFAWIFWLAVVILVVVVVRWLFGRRDSGGGTQEDESLRILKNRYARGEIDKEQYEEMRRDLER